MQCPNCNKEAINVNGKYVCLDCGIEINPTQPAVAPAPTPIITQNSGNPLGVSQNSPEESVSLDTIIPNVSEPMTTSVAPETVISTPQSSPTPLKDEVEAQLSQVSPELNTLENDLPRPQETTPNSPLPDFPGLDSAEPTVNTPAPSENTPVIPTPLPESAPLQIAVAPPIPENQVPSVSSDEVGSFFQPSQVDIVNTNIEIPQAENNPPIAASVGMADISSNNLDIAPVEAQNNPVQSPVVDNAISSSEQSAPITVPPVAQTEPAPVQVQVEQVAPAASLDDMLGSSPGNSSFQPNVPAPQTVEPVQDVLDGPATSQPSYPGAPMAAPMQPANNSGQIPSYESVFGNQDNTQSAAPVQQAEPVGVKALFANKKMIFIIVGVVAVLLLGGIGFVAFLGMGGNDQAEETNQVDQALLSQNVQEAMEGDVNAVVKYEQTIDFSDVTLTDSVSDPENPSEAEGDISKASAVNKGVWKANSEGDVSIDSSINKVGVQKIYIDSEKETYGITTSATAWTKQQGKLLSEVPDFYGPDTRAKIFYVNQAEGVTSLGKEEIEGTDYNKYQIKPKPEYVAEIIKGSNPLFENLEFEEVIVDNLDVYVWLDDENKIVKVEATGDVGISGGSFEDNSTVTINSVAEYSYQDDVEIEKPSTSASNPFDSQNNTAQIDKEVAPSVIKTIEVNKKDAGRG